MGEILDIVNEQDEVIGTAERSVAHAEGLKIRLVYVWFYVPDGRIIMQRRHANKKAYPNRLTCTAGGHVESGMSYREAAVKEVGEETGVELTADQLQEAGKVFKETHAARSISAAFRMTYAYRYKGSVDDLKVEPGEGAGFELWAPGDLLVALDETPERFTGFMLSEASREIIRKIMEITQ